ncbi:MAG: TolC family protein [Candidatus Syntrophosphaera sp.]|nr:TolC family protein [Candidatus Syntrophosphaera sp.]
MKRLTLLALFLPVALLAQQYTVDDLIGYGLQNSWSMQKSELGYLSSSSNLSSAKWNLLPDASLGLRVENDLYNQAAPAVSDLSSSAGFTISKTISLNDPSWFNYKYAKLDEKKARMVLENSASNYAYRVFSAYLDVLAAQKQLASLARNLEIQTRVWEQSKVLNQLGKNTSFDVKQSEIAVMNSRIAIIQLENTISTKRRELFGLVRMEDGGHELTDLDYDPDFSVPPFSTEQSLGLKLLEADIQRGELSRRQNWLDYFPRVNLAYNYSRNLGGQDFDFDHYNTSHTVSLNLSYSLWNHFKQNQVIKRSDFSLRLAELDLQDQIDQNARQHQIMDQELQYLLRLDELLLEKLEQSSNQIRIAEERYRLGLIELLELDKTRTDYIDADIAYNNNRYQILAKQEAINHLLSLKILGKW